MTSKITDYFSTRKRTDTTHASKRRKIETRSKVGPKATSAVVSALTTVWDEHDGPVTPSKTVVVGPGSGRKRSRKTVNKTDQEDSTPEKRMQPVTQKRSPVRARKMLQMRATVEVEDTHVKPVEGSTVEKIPPFVPSTVQPSSTEPKISNKVNPKPIHAKPVSSTVPAYERFHHLVTAPPPSQTVAAPPSKPLTEPPSRSLVAPSSQSLTTSPSKSLTEPPSKSLGLPFKYRLLEEQFRGMDLILKLRNNQRTTFSELKPAVYKATKKELDLKQVGQIKTVYPTAYDLQQEKLPGNAGYQLTVEANMVDIDQGAPKNTPFKPSYPAARLSRFHKGLIQIVKRHHKEFLSKLSPPLSIPDSKVTRWHPAFRVNDVPEVEVAALPTPPAIPTAADVLTHHRGTLSARVKAALEKTATEVDKLAPKSYSPAAPMATTSSPVSSPALKGVPQSLLERIRAKEAAKAEAVITRDSGEVKRVGMMQRLPDMMRILRAHFVTEKKPSLPLETVIQRVHGSLKTSIPAGDVESHLNLCMELVPGWLSTVTIRRGKYLKMDRNIDVQCLVDKVNGMIKHKQ